jgi:DNA invertase Pin-like site-specific DNA recombinase
MTGEAGARIALYARVSTNGKKDDGTPKQNTEMQLQPMRDECARRGWVIVEEFVDRASGAKASRPALDKMMAAACSQDKPFDAVMVWKLDRFGRSSNHLSNAVAALTEHGVSFVSLTDGFDMTTAQGRLMFGMLAAFAEFERELIRERVTAGIKRAQAAAAKAGRVRGAGAKRQALDIQSIKDRMFMGESQRQIAQSLGVSPSLLTKRLKESQS